MLKIVVRSIDDIRPDYRYMSFTPNGKVSEHSYTTVWYLDASDYYSDGTLVDIPKDANGLTEMYR